MGRKVKDKEQPKNKLSLDTKGIATCQNDKALPLFSFAHTTNDKNHNFECFTKNTRLELDTRKALDALFSEISNTSWLELRQRRKDQIGGYELISFWQVKFSPNNLTLAKDAKILSFRFGSADAFRLLGWRKDSCQALYIIGYDFDFSAYNHGS